LAKTIQHVRLWTNLAWIQSRPVSLRTPYTGSVWLYSRTPSGKTRLYDRTHHESNHYSAVVERIPAETSATAAALGPHDSIGTRSCTSPARDGRSRCTRTLAAGSILPWIGSTWEL